MSTFFVNIRHTLSTIFVNVSIFGIVSTLVGVLLVVAYYTLFERKGLGSFQRRRGPNVVGFWGVFQPFADALKLVIKENAKPTSAHAMYGPAPALALIVALLSWAILPIGPADSFIRSNISLLFLLGVSSLGVYGLIGGGWASGSRYAILGGLRAAAQFVSYEVALGIVLVPLVLLGGLSVEGIVD